MEINNQMEMDKERQKKQEAYKEKHSKWKKDVWIATTLLIVSIITLSALIIYQLM